MNSIAIIPARGGSKGIPKKNIYLLAGYPLIAYSIAAAKLSTEIERIIVSTDSVEIADVAIRYGAEVPFIRPFEFALDNSTDREFFLHAMKWIEENEREIPEYWIHLRPTTPLRDPMIIDEAILRMVGNREATSLRSGHPAPESPFKWFKLDVDGYFTGIRENDERVEYYNLPRQAFPEVYVPDGYVDIVRASVVQNSGHLHGDKMIGYVSPVCLEVDRIEDMERLEFEIMRKDCELLDYLRKTYP